MHILCYLSLEEDKRQVLTKIKIAIFLKLYSMRILQPSLLIVIMILSLFASSCTKKEQQPNIVFVFPDQYRRASLGYMNEDPVHTPNIDNMASQGLVFKNAVSTIPVCSPFRGMLMTGNFYTVNNLPQNCNSNHEGIYLRTEEGEVITSTRSIILAGISSRP